MMKSPSNSLKIAVLVVALIALLIGAFTNWYSLTVGIILAVVVGIVGMLALKMVAKTPEQGAPQTQAAPPSEQPKPAEPMPEQSKPEPEPEPAPVQEPQEQEPKTE
jgi:outer membrane biosynthesis protein TonB